MADDLIKSIEVLNLQAGDILFVELSDFEEAAIEQARYGIQHAIDHIGLTEDVSVLFHDGGIGLKIVRTA